jgi:hypothetical protein
LFVVAVRSGKVKKFFEPPTVNYRRFDKQTTDEGGDDSKKEI